MDDDKFQAAYSAWLRNPITKEVFRRMELSCRPDVISPAQITEHGAAYALGFTTGAWCALDGARKLAVFSGDNEPNATYLKEESAQ
jgi:hypothetical protein